MESDHERRSELQLMNPKEPRRSAADLRSLFSMIIFIHMLPGQTCMLHVHSTSVSCLPLHTPVKGPHVLAARARVDHARPDRDRPDSSGFVRI